MADGTGSLHTGGGGWRLVWSLLAAAVLLGGARVGWATDLTLHLEGNTPVQRTRVLYRCDGAAVSLGLPAGAFTVEYVNAGLNHLALLPLAGGTVIFATVPSASGARYAAERFIWWEAGARGVTLMRDDLSKTVSTACRAQRSPTPTGR